MEGPEAALGAKGRGRGEGFSGMVLPGQNYSEMLPFRTKQLSFWERYRDKRQWGPCGTTFCTILAASRRNCLSP